MTTTAIQITAAARVLADVVDEGIAAGLPEPYGISVQNYSEHHLGVREFGEVEAWAGWLGVAVQQYLSHDETAEFCEARSERDGIKFRVITNRPVEQ